jgi:hypothetical protein
MKATNNTSLVVALIILCAVNVSPAAANGSVVLDQNWPVNSDGVWQFISEYVGEIADVATSGRLVRVTVPMQVAHFGSNQSDTLDWFILSVSNGHPVTTLANGSIPDSQIGSAANLDLSSFDLNFTKGDQFAFALHGHSALYSWFSYRGQDAPFHRSISGNGSSWFIEPDFYNPTYIGAYSSYIEVVPEPSATFLAALGTIGFLAGGRRRIVESRSGAMV